jgi:hypothetical protein
MSLHEFCIHSCESHVMYRTRAHGEDKKHYLHLVLVMVQRDACKLKMNDETH